jgi:hypothetical protein
MKPFADLPALCGPLRRPRQMLAEQVYDSHKSIHDDATAAGLGLRAGPIEGPTHFSQFDPLLHHLFGQAWFESGCISAHYQNMVVEGEEVRAFVQLPATGACVTRIWAEKRDGVPVLTGTASVAWRSCVHRANWSSTATCASASRVPATPKRSAWASRSTWGRTTPSRWPTS